MKKDKDMEVKRYYVSAERGQRVDRFWFRTEEEARDKFTDLLAARGADWDIRMRRLDDADLERERRISARHETRVAVQRHRRCRDSRGVAGMG